MSYQQVSDALRNGADPAMLCMTCPWDRNCITPPAMTRAEVEERIAAAEQKDQARGEGLPVHTLMVAAMVGGADTKSSICPVLAMQLRTSEGRGIVDTLKAHMQAGGA